VDHVAVLDQVVFAFLAEQPVVAGFGFAPDPGQLLEKTMTLGDGDS